jgi:hypothetical protein
MRYALRGGRRLLLSLMILLFCGALNNAAWGMSEEGKDMAKSLETSAPYNAKKQEDAAIKAVEEARQAYEKEKRERQEKLRSDPHWQASHEQVDVIDINKGAKNRRAVHSFCLNSDGDLLVCCGGDRPPESGREPKTDQATANDATQQGEVLLLSPEGKKVGSWKSTFEPQAICIASDGTIFVGGQGKLKKLDKDGKLLLLADAPNAAALPLPPVPKKGREPEGKDAEMVKKAKEKRIAEQQASLKEAQDEYRKTTQAASKDLIPNDDASMETYQARIRGPLEKLQSVQEELTDLQMTREMRAARLRAERDRRLAITGIAITDRDLFLACMSPLGFGYEVWRTDRNFGAPKKIISNLAGCCGLMDIHAHDGDLWIANNARHRVERYDRDGKKRSSFGKTDRSDADGFGGCCEPKNLRFASNGEFFAIESEPQVCVKRFTTAGKFLSVAVVAPWESSCVQSTTEFKASQDKFFVLNSGQGTIHVFAKKGQTRSSSFKSEDKR